MSSPTTQSVSPVRNDHDRLQWHMIGEYPPQPGGVSDYSYSVAAALAGAGDEVHVWSPAYLGQAPVPAGVVLHRDLGAISREDLRATGQKLDQYLAPRRILLQWVPHAYGYRSMNLGLCWWIWNRARRHGDQVEIMVHEPFLPFRRGLWRQNVAALVHRLMTILLLQAAGRVLVSTPAWEQRWRRYSLGRRVPFEWVPIPSGVLPVENRPAAQAVRRRFVPENDLLIGHFGTHGPAVTALLEPILLGLNLQAPRQTVLLMGIGSTDVRERIIRKQPRLAQFLHATGPLDPSDLSYHMAACDIMIQPYAGGVCCRNSSLMAALCHGKPIVTTTGSLTEPFWAGTQALALAPEGNPNAFLEELAHLMQDSGERSQMGQAAGRLYRQQFDVSYTVKSLRREAGVLN
jgi:glycosyltransferase involved in cell wall biosynthesis